MEAAQILDMSQPLLMFYAFRLPLQPPCSSGSGGASSMPRRSTCRWAWPGFPTAGSKTRGHCLTTSPTATRYGSKPCITCCSSRNGRVGHRPHLYPDCCKSLKYLCLCRGDPLGRPSEGRGMPRPYTVACTMRTKRNRRRYRRARSARYPDCVPMLCGSI